MNRPERFVDLQRESINAWSLLINSRLRVWGCILINIYLGQVVKKQSTQLWIIYFISQLSFE